MTQDTRNWYWGTCSGAFLYFWCPLPKQTKWSTNLCHCYCITKHAMPYRGNLGMKNGTQNMKFPIDVIDTLSADDNTWTTMTRKPKIHHITKNQSNEQFSFSKIYNWNDSIYFFFLMSSISSFKFVLNCWIKRRSFSADMSLIPRCSATFFDRRKAATSSWAALLIG